MQKCIWGAMESRLIEKAGELGVISPLFLNKKPDGNFRMILDLKEVNKYVEYQHFKMQTFNDARNIIDKDDFLIKIDLKSAYDSVPIHRESRKYLQFSFNNEIFQFRGFPNGLSEAPKFFTKLTKPLLSYAHKLGIKLVMYIDDILVAYRDKAGLLEQASVIIQLLMYLGFVINENKSILVPCKSLDFLGYQINSSTMEFRITEERILQILGKCERLMRGTYSARKVASLTGLLQFAIKAIPIGALYFRSLQAQVSTVTIDGNWENPIVLNYASVAEVNWWMLNVRIENGTCIRSPPVTVIMTTDASKVGWGATYKNLRTSKKLKSQGPWTKVEKEEHINVLELKAAKNGLSALAEKVQNTTIKLMMDNTTAIAVMKKKGSSKSKMLNELAIEIWSWARYRKITLMPGYLPGTHNTEADDLSRKMVDSSDWKLDPRIFKQISRKKDHFKWIFLQALGMPS